MKLDEVLALEPGNSNQWVLRPTFIAKVKPADYADIIKKSRVALVHDNWPDAQEAVRELSDYGGIESVTIMRVRVQCTSHVTFRDGKQS
jgi:hypothetical protein